MLSCASSDPSTNAHRDTVSQASQSPQSQHQANSQPYNGTAERAVLLPMAEVGDTARSQQLPCELHQNMDAEPMHTDEGPYAHYPLEPPLPFTTVDDIDSVEWGCDSLSSYAPPTSFCNSGAASTVGSAHTLPTMNRMHLFGDMVTEEEGEEEEEEDEGQEE
jgi:hypothetical protein